MSSSRRSGSVSSNSARQSGLRRDTRWPLLFSLVGYLGIRLPAAYLLAFTYGMGVAGAWYAMVLDLVLRCIMINIRFWHGGWQKVEV